MKSVSINIVCARIRDVMNNYAGMYREYNLKIYNIYGLPINYENTVHWIIESFMYIRIASAYVMSTFDF